MRTKTARIHAAFLAAVMTLSMAACGETAETEDTRETETESVPETEPAREVVADLPEKDFGGYTFRILTKGKFNSHWQSKDVTAEEMNGEHINDAVFTRNAAVTDTYNITIEELWGTDVNPTPLAQQAILASEDAYDLILHGADIKPLITEGLLLDWKDIPYVDLEKPWYDQNANDALSIANKLYVTASDITIMDNDATWAVLFNKPLAENMDLDDLYELAKEGKWTQDKLLAAVQDAARDLNGDGTQDEFDQWGISGEGFNTMALIVGAGANCFSKDENDLPVAVADGEHFYDAFQLAAEINCSKEHALLVDWYYSKYTDVWGDCMDKCFSESRALFTIAGLNRVTLFREMDADFGILPIPKWDEAQEEYRNIVSMWCSAMIAMPITVSDTERNGIIVEALAYESMYTLTPAYYEVVLKTKAARDEESAEMLDLIFSSRVYELGNLYGWGDLFNRVNYVAVNNPDTLASSISSNAGKVETDIQATLDAMNK